MSCLIVLGDAPPPPGLHRLVTGQGGENPVYMFVKGAPHSFSQAELSSSHQESSRHSTPPSSIGESGKILAVK
jgi:hypothetical protein